MPRKAKDFSKGLIYKLCCKDTSIKEIYVGSSTNFTQRKRSHKSSCNNPNGKQSNLKVYQFIRENGNWDNWDMVLIEYYPCETELELGRKEDYWKQELQSSLNSITPPLYENVKEYQQANKETIQEYKKEYYETNRETIAEQKKEYYHTKKEQILEKVKEYCEANREKIAEKRKQKITCECGCDVSRGNTKKHEKTAKHISFISAKQIPLDLNIQENLS